MEVVANPVATFWLKLYADLGIKMEAAHQDREVRGELYGRKTENYALIRAELSKGMKLVEDCAKEASSEIGSFIFRGVTEGISYTQLRMLDGLPCGQDMYYDRYRRFFYILSQKRGL